MADVALCRAAMKSKRLLRNEISYARMKDILVVHAFLATNPATPSASG